MVEHCYLVGILQSHTSHVEGSNNPPWQKEGRRKDLSALCDLRKDLQPPEGGQGPPGSSLQNLLDSCKIEQGRVSPPAFTTKPPMCE